MTDRQNALLTIATAALQGYEANPDPQFVSITDTLTAALACNAAEALLAEAQRRWGIKFDDEPEPAAPTPLQAGEVAP